MTVAFIWGVLLPLSGVMSHSPGFPLSYDSACECPVCALLCWPLHSLFPQSQCSSDIFLTSFHAHHWLLPTIHRWWLLTSASPSTSDLYMQPPNRPPLECSRSSLNSACLKQYFFTICFSHIDPVLVYWKYHAASDLFAHTFVLKHTSPPAKSYSLRRSYNWLSQEACPHSYIRIWGLCDIAIMTI